LKETNDPKTILELGQKQREKQTTLTESVLKRKETKGGGREAARYHLA
jgi:hypothetical protein